jgi:hypothetical protein
MVEAKTGSTSLEHPPPTDVAGEQETNVTLRLAFCDMDWHYQQDWEALILSWGLRVRKFSYSGSIKD